MTDTRANSQGSAVEESIAPLPVYEDLNEQQLREIYDNDEINRFLHIFSTVILFPYTVKLYSSRNSQSQKFTVFLQNKALPRAEIMLATQLDMSRVRPSIVYILKQAAEIQFPHFQAPYVLVCMILMPR